MNYKIELYYNNEKYFHEYINECNDLKSNIMNKYIEFCILYLNQRFFQEVLILH